MAQDFSLSAAQVRCYSVAVTVPNITDPDTDSSAETVTGVKLGDIVIASPTTAFVDTNARYLGAYATAKSRMRERDVAWARKNLPAEAEGRPDRAPL